VFCTICRCDLRIADTCRDDIKKAKSAAEISAANIRKTLLKLREKAYWPMQLLKKHVATKKHVIAATANPKRPSR